MVTVERMQTYYIETYGCALARYETMLMEEMLRDSGYKKVATPENADVIIINTCAVRLDTEQRIADRLVDLVKKHGSDKIIVAGCLAKARPGLIRRIAPKAKLIAPQAVHLIHKVIRSPPGYSMLWADRDVSITPKSPIDRSRGLVATIMIQEGCLNNCSYCITKLSRGGPKSYPPRKIIEQVYNAVKAGAVEIRLTGTDTGVYGVDLPGKPTITDLVWMILDKVEGNYKIRIGMMTPEAAIELDKPLLEAYNDERIFKFFHIPVQSGDDEVLRIMGRRYTVREFLNLHSRVKNWYPDSLFATDIIVGHPGETEEAFQNTVKLVREARFERVHLAQYSIRPHTRAAAMKQLSDGVKKKRSKILTKIIEEIGKQIYGQYMDKEVKAILTEKGFRKRTITGRMNNYFPIVIRNSEESLLGKTVKVKITDYSFFDLRGRITKIIQI